MPNAIPPSNSPANNECHVDHLPTDDELIVGVEVMADSVDGLEPVPVSYDRLAPFIEEDPFVQEEPVEPSVSSRSLIELGELLSDPSRARFVIVLRTDRVSDDIVPDGVEIHSVLAGLGWALREWWEPVAGDQHNGAAA